MLRRYISKSISTKLTLPFAVVFLFVLVGLVLFATTSRYTFHQMEEFHEQIDHIFKVNRIHASSFRLILLAHHFLLTKEPTFLTEFENLLGQLKSETEKYIELEESKGYQEAEKETVFMKEVQAGIQRLRSSSDNLFRDFSSTGKVDSELMDKVESEAYKIEFEIEKVNQTHQERIDKLLSVSKARVGFLLRLFVIFILLGAILLILVNIIAVKYVVAPVKKLAIATADLAGGNLQRRVDINSSDEIGALARSFNEMAEKLEIHDHEHHDFSMQLEQMVKERTRELMRTTERLRTTQARLVRTEQQAAVGRLAAGVAHEIRTPLNSLAINFQLVRRQLRETVDLADDSISGAFNDIDLEVSRMNRVLEEFVAYARFPEPRLKRIEINPLVQQVAGFLAPEAAESGKTVETKLNPGVPLIEADEEQIRQVLLNLCMNGIQAMPEGGTVTIETKPMDKMNDSGPGVRICIRDEGEGIPPEDIGRIFEPFYSTKPDGLGLGLAIVTHIVDQHNGQIFCRSEVGEGTTFEVQLPLSNRIKEAAFKESE